MPWMGSLKPNPVRRPKSAHPESAKRKAKLSLMIHTRLIEARALILHGLSENIAEHEAYMTQMREMVKQCERVHWQTMRDRGLPFPADPPVDAVQFLPWRQRLRWLFRSRSALTQQDLSA